MLAVLAFSFAACLGSTANSTPSYVNTYYINGTKNEVSYVTIYNGGTWELKYKNGDLDIFFAGKYVYKDSAFTFYGADGYKITEDVIMTQASDGAWIITLDGNEFKVAVAESGCASGNYSTYIVFGVLIVAIIGLFIWSSISKRKQAKKAQDTVNKLKVGDRVKTIGGICGFVSEIDDSENTFVLEVKAGDKSSFVKFDKGAIYQTAPADGNGSDAKPAEEKAEDGKQDK